MPVSWPAVDELYPWFWNIVRAGFYLLGAALLSLVVNWAFSRFQQLAEQLRRDRGGLERAEFEKQSATFTTTARRFVLILLWALAGILVLKEFKFDVAPLLAGAGVAGLAIGFAAQNLLKDVLNGFFMLAEGHMRINDVVKIGDLSGVVEELTLRTTVLRGVDGAVHVISNGSFGSFSNLTRVYAFYVIDLTIDFGEDPDRAIAIITDVGRGLRQDPTFELLILDPLEVLGVDKFTEQGVVIKARIKTVANQQWKVGREFNRRLMAELERNGVRIATAQRQIQLMDTSLRREIREALREELAVLSGQQAAGDAEERRHPLSRA